MLRESMECAHDVPTAFEYPQRVGDMAEQGQTQPLDIGLPCNSGGNCRFRVDTYGAAVACAKVGRLALY
jgi:hypothetical protein